MNESSGKVKAHVRLRTILEFIFGFENRRGEVQSSWIYPVESPPFSSDEFYTSVEEAVRAHNISNLAISRQAFAEGGLLSRDRLYLRLMRERLTIDTCAAPFGSIFFFSCRTVYVPALVRLWHLLAAFSFFVATFVFLVIPLGFLFALIALVTLVFALAAVLRNATRNGFPDLDTLLLRVPVVSTFYEDWFREETYYREDTRTLYLDLFPNLIKQMVEEACAAKGVKIIRSDGKSPLITALHKRVKDMPAGAP